MKIIKLFLLLMIVATSVKAQGPIIDIPDVRFKLLLLWNNGINTTVDAEIDSTEAANYTGSIIIFNEGISDLTGIEAFTSFTFLNCSDNDLASIDISACVGLNELWAYNNNLTNLDISSNVLLTSLWLDNNPLTTLDVSNNSVLTSIGCWNNNISSLDISNNPLITSLGCGSNDMIYLNAKNGNNINMSFGATLNPSLCISVDDPTWANANWSTFKDPTASFNNNCTLDAHERTSGYDHQNNIMYDLNGVEIKTKDYRGVYIMNGVKYFSIR